MSAGMQQSTAVLIPYACPRCGTKAEAPYDRGERQYGDLPECARKCAVPYTVLDAVAAWLDERAMDGAGVPVAPSRADLCGFAEGRRV